MLKGQGKNLVESTVNDVLGLVT